MACEEAGANFTPPSPSPRKMNGRKEHKEFWVLFEGLFLVRPVRDNRITPGGTPLYKVYRYVPPQRVWFLSRFGLKKGTDFDNYGLKSGRIFGAGNIYESLQTYFSSQYVTGTTN